MKLELTKRELVTLENVVFNKIQNLNLIIPDKCGVFKEFYINELRDLEDTFKKITEMLAKEPNAKAFKYYDQRL